jgi:hypothetical protein
MGCLMASYSSDEVFEYELDEDEVVDTWATVLSTSLDTGERGYEDIHLLQNGVLLTSGDRDYDRLYERARVAADEIIRKREDDARKTKEAEEQRKRAENETRERKEYERLQKKFGDLREA